MKFSCQLAIAALVAFDFLVMLYGDSRRESSDSRFIANVITIAAVVTKICLYYGAGLFSELLS